MSLDTLLHELRLDPGFMRQVAAWRRFPPRPARTADFPPAFDPRLVASLRARGIERLYSHQATAVAAALRGEHVAVVTPAASGKTLCYNLPVLHTLLNDPSARALYLFPTKALAQDQLAELRTFAQSSALSAIGHWPFAVYDGDTPKAERPRIRRAARLLITNPDMLHTGILPHHTQWADLFANLRYVVLDEVHAYRGVFGSHVANVLRRLRRICQFHGSQPQFICCSATIANPQEHAERLLEVPVTLVDDDGSPRGEKHFLLYNPPLVDRELGIRRSHLLEARGIAGRLLDADVQTIVFARARLTVEILLTYLRDWVERADRETGGRGDKERERREGEGAERAEGIEGVEGMVRGYRGGYLPQQRREIEQGLRQGSVRGVVATNALELGIDIGQLSAAVLVGYPGTIASAWQQAGRAGRRTETSLAVLVASASPLDQYLVAHPDYLFERSPEQALIHPDNLVILLHHLRCAAFELPFAQGETFGGFGDVAALLDVLAEEGEMHHSAQAYHWIGETYPAQEVSLRTASPDRFVIMAAGDADSQPQVIGEVDRFSVPFLLHEGAVYLHEGQSYLVERLDWEGQQAFVRAADVGYYTDASSSEQVQVLEVREQSLEGGTLKAHGEVLVRCKTTGYRRIKRYTHENLGWGEIDLPEQELETTAYWLSFPEETVERLRLNGLWVGDRLDYGPNWAAQRERARARDGYRCRHCGAPEQPGRQHEVHHLRPFREFGYVPGENEAYLLANRLENLVTLCPACHRLAEAGQRMRSGLAGLGYALSYVASLHLMCDPRDLGSVTEARAASTNLPTITLYEKVPGGLGFAGRLYELHTTLLQAAHELVSACPCAHGCPACVGPVLDPQQETKALTLALIEAALTPRQLHPHAAGKPVS
ncbi:MAG: DEAD/DEAH box helicase [Anaerolineae bacterium]|nr:DEAD/DEAH box helicase [Anaerolineae bacterium]